MHRSKVFRCILPALPIAIPSTGPFQAECRGMARPPDVARLARRRDELLQAPRMTKDRLWSLPTHEALAFISAHSTYHAVAAMVMEQGLFSLFPAMMDCKDAPLPHVMYTDFLRCRTFSSLQSPPEEQFSLPPELLQKLLLRAATFLRADAAYFHTVHRWYRSMELQQHIGAEAASAWVACCVAAGRHDAAVEALHAMARNGIAFDAQVFCRMMQPTAGGDTLDPVAALTHRRLCSYLAESGDAAAVGIHASFCYNALLLQQAAKWEVLREGVVSGIVCCARTLDLALAAFVEERGQHTGPQTRAALCRCFAFHGNLEGAVAVLSLCLQEGTAIPQDAFEAVAELVHVRGPEAGTVAVRALRRMRIPPTEALTALGAVPSEPARNIHSLLSQLQLD